MLPYQVQSSPINYQLLSIASVKRTREEGAATLPSSEDAYYSLLLELQKTCNSPFPGRNGTACPWCREGRGSREQDSLLCHIKGWVLQKRREDGYEMLKENVGSKDTHSQREPRLGNKKNLSPEWTAHIIKRKKSLFSYLLTQRRYVVTEANSSKWKDGKPLFLLQFSDMLCLVEST